MKIEKTVMLGCWGLGRTIYYRERKNVLKLKSGPFKGYLFPSAFSKKFENYSNWHLPPLSQSSIDGIDFMPFILYDKIIIDKLSLECILGNQESIIKGKIKNNTIRILEKLAEDGHIIEKDYDEELIKRDLLSILDQTMLHDLSDISIIGPCKESLKLWIKFNKEFLEQTDTELNVFYDMLNALEKMDEKSNNYSKAFGLLYESIADINRIILLSQSFNYPVYEWEDYLQYYKYKSARMGELHDNTEGETLNKLFDLFIPDFTIHDYKQLIDIKCDSRLDSVRELIVQLKDKELSNDIVIKAQEDVLSINEKILTYSNYIGIGGYILSFLPGLISNTIQLVANKVLEKYLKRTIKWQTFFIDRKNNYGRRDIELRLKNLSI